MILRSVNPISATKHLTPSGTDHVSLHSMQVIPAAMVRSKCIYTMLPSIVYNSSTTTRSLTQSLHQPRDSHHFGSTPLHTLLPTQPNPTTLPAHASITSSLLTAIHTTKMRTSLTFLTLLAAAGTAVAAPVPASNGGNGAIQKIVSGHHRRSDSQVMVDLTEHLVSNTLDIIRNQLICQTDHKSYKSNKQEMTKEYKESEKDVKSDKQAVKAAGKKFENRRSRSNKRAIVSLFPDQDPGSKAGVVDASNKDANAHLIQTPGKDRTIVDVKAGDIDAKVNLPKDTPAPVKDASMTHPSTHNPQGQVKHEEDDLFKGVGVSLGSKKGPVSGAPLKSPAGQTQHEEDSLFKGTGVSLGSLGGKNGPLNGVVNDGKGGPQGIEVSDWNFPGVSGSEIRD